MADTIFVIFVIKTHNIAIKNCPAELTYRPFDRSDICLHVEIEAHYIANPRLYANELFLKCNENAWTTTEDACFLQFEKIFSTTAWNAGKLTQTYIGYLLQTFLPFV